MKIKKHHFIFFVLLLTTIVYGCETSGQIPITPSILLASLTPLPSTLPATLMSSPVVIDTPTISPSTLTPLPALNSEQALAKVQDLLHTNGNCSLPCWWGIEPGETIWENAKNSLAPLTTDTREGVIQSGETVVEMLFPVRISDSTQSGFQQRFVINNGVVDDIRIKVPVNSPFHEPQRFLSEFNTPSQVYLGGIIEPNAHQQSFTIVFYYSNLGILVLFDTGLKPIQYKSVLNICFSNIFYVELYLWSPKSSFDGRLQSILEQYPHPFHSIEDVTNLRLDTFKQQFTKDSSCLNTTANLWPGHQ